jgi:hypothetical protein
VHLLRRILDVCVDEEPVVSIVPNSTILTTGTVSTILI